MAASGAALLSASLLIPISRSQPEKPRVIEPPSALQEVQNWLDNVKKNDAVNPESIDQVEEKMAELLQRPAQNWYEHASLEAAEHLRDVTAADLQQLTQNLADAERAANALAASASGSGLPQAAKDSLQQTLQNASQSMQGAGMQPSGDLIDALKNIDPSQLSNMSADQLKDLAKQLAQNQQSLQQALKNAPSLDLSNIPEGRPGKGDGEGEKEGSGKGAPKRGPGTAPVTLASEDTQLDTNKIETLKNPLDLSRLATGDALSVTNGAAKIDPKTYQGAQQGGATTSPGDGGAAVWQNSLIPAERETLKRFFK
jgi:myosin heavy subunit